MKDYYSSLHKFLSSHFPAQIHKLEAIKGNDVEVIKMYNMYKQLAKDKLQERQESADGNKSQDVAKGINTAINNVDESLDYRDFAKAVAITLKENYGTHNVAPFMEVLHAELGINEVKVESLEEGKSEHIVKHSESNNTYQVWLGDEIVTDFATKERANAEVKRLNALQSVNEAKATCCLRCGRVHVKGTPCKKPYLKGKDSCAINEIKTLKEFYNK
jgi:hypothetical protein